MSIPICLEMQLKIRYLPHMAYGKDLNLRVVEYVEDGHTLTRSAAVSKYIPEQPSHSVSATRSSAM